MRLEITPSTVPVEVVQVFTALGIRFWDTALDVPVSEGLVVKAYWSETDYPPVEAFRTKSGAYAFQGLPGMHAVEYPENGGSLPSLPVKKTYQISVEDVSGRFLPMVFGVDLPLDYPGLFLSGDTASLPGAPGRAFLITAPTRPIVSGLAQVRADIWDADNACPAAHAILRVQFGSDFWTGIANQNGSALVTFPFPISERLRLGSPPGSGQGSVSDSRWPVRVTVRYQPSRLRYPLADRSDVPERWKSLPSLRTILGQQQVPMIVRDNPLSETAEWNAELTFRQPLVVKTAVPASQDRSRLMVRWGTSPP
ncbi:MAG: hypothetical protein U0R19_27850 [Bryobacteraceae bacterium]